jgi:hypothetical protein
MKTSSFYLYQGLGRISIARYPARGTPAGFRVYSKLAPGSWFRSVSSAEYIERYDAEILAKLDPQKVWDDLIAMAAPHEPVLLCYERPPFSDVEPIIRADAVAGPSNWCHRRLVANWFRDTLGMEVREYKL